MGDQIGSGAAPDCLSLAEAENDFLQVLVDGFTLSKNADEVGATLRMGFNSETKAIRQRAEKSELRDWTRRDKSKAAGLQKQIDGVLQGGGQQSFDHSDPDFPFRHANGGALPVISMGDKSYYCFHWRDIAPVGWNIANGGSDNRQELLRPELIIERELLEELIVIDPRPESACRYVFETDEGGKSIDRDAEAAWREWRKRFIDNGYPADLQHCSSKLPLMWLGGTDRLVVEFEGKTQPPVEGVFLNINAADFGIEIDRVVQLRLPQGAVLCDGELLGGQLLDSAIGLFEVEKMREAIKDEGNRDFRPDFLFHGGRAEDPNDLERVADKFLQEKEQCGQRTEKDGVELEEAKGNGAQFDLCPVTRTVVNRHLDLCSGDDEERPGEEELDVFLSFASEDSPFADRVCKALEDAKLNVFYSDKTLSDTDYGRAIDDALGKAHCLIAVGTKVDHLMKGWPEYEWRSFSQEMLSGNEENRELISLISGFGPADLPRQLRFRQAIECQDPEAPETVLPEVLRFVGGG